METKLSYKELENIIADLKNQYKELRKDNIEKDKQIKSLEQELFNIQKLIKNSEKSANVGSWSYDLVSGNIYWSDNMCKIHGLEPSEFDGTLEMARKYIHPEDIEEVAAKTQKSIIDKKPLVFEYRIITRSGDIKYIYGNNDFIYDKKGEITQVFGMNIDITQQKLTENKFKDLFEKSGDAILIIENEIFTDCNNATVEMLNYSSKSEFLNVHPSKLSPEFQPDGKKSVLKANEMMNIAMEKGTHRFEWQHLKKTGEEFPVEVLLTRISNDPKKRIIHTVWRDITNRKNAEIAIKESEEKFRKSIEFSPVPMAVAKSNGDLIFHNKQFIDTYGYTIQDTPSISKWFDIVYPDPEYRKFVIDDWTKAAGKAAKTNSLTSVREYNITCKNGQVKTAAVSAFLEKEYSIGIFIDVTKQKQSEEILVDSERRFRILFESAAVGVSQIDTRTGKFVRTNKKYADIVGYSVEEMKTINFMKITHPDDLKIDLKNMELLKKGEIEEFSMEKRYYHKNGHIVWVNLFVSPMWEKGSDFDFHIAVVNDITIQKEAEKALKESENKLRERVKELEGIYSLGLLAEKYSSLPDIYNDFVKNIIAQSMQFPDKIVACLEINNQVYCNIENCKISDNKKCLSANIKIFGKLFGKLIVTYIEDLLFIDKFEQKLINAYAERLSMITERIIAKQQLVAAKEKLEESNRTKDRFFSIIAHDLRSPFGALLGFSKLLLNEHKEYNEDKKTEIIKIIYQSAENTFKLIENLLTWSRAQLNAIEFLPHILNLKTETSNVLYSLQSQANKKGITIINAINDEELIMADRNMIAAILRNLISNAIKFTKSGGIVDISSKKSKNKDFIEVTVTDSGIGISPDVLKDLFRIDRNTSTKGTDNEEGTGLGLLLCKEFVEKHHGEIWVESELGRGSDFKLTLPIV